MNVAVDHFGFVVFGKKSTEWMTYVRVFPKDWKQGMLSLLDTVQDDKEQNARRSAYFLVKQKKLKVSSAKDWEWLIQEYLLYSKSPSKSPPTSADEFVQGLAKTRLNKEPNNNKRKLQVPEENHAQEEPRSRRQRTSLNDASGAPDGVLEVRRPPSRTSQKTSTEKLVIRHWSPEFRRLRWSIPVLRGVVRYPR